MKYKRPSGEILTMAQVENLAASQDPPISAYEYIDNMGLAAYTEEPEFEDFQIGMTQDPGASVMSNQVAPNNTGSSSGNISSDLLKADQVRTASATADLDAAITSYERADEDFEFKGGATGYVKSLRYQKIKDEERKLRNAPYNLFAPASFLDEEPDEVLKYLTKELSSSGIGFELKGNTIYADVNGEILELPLTGDRMLGQGGTAEYSDSFLTTALYGEKRKEFNKNFNKILAYDRATRGALHEVKYQNNVIDLLQSDIAVNNITSGLKNGSISSIEFNNTLNGTGYSLKPYYYKTDEDATSAQGIQTLEEEQSPRLKGYKLIYGDEVVATNDFTSLVTRTSNGEVTYNEDTIEKYLKENLNTDQQTVLRKNLFKGFAAYVQNEKKMQNDVKNSITPQQVNAKFASNSNFEVFENALFNILQSIDTGDGPLFNKEEIQTLKNHFDEAGKTDFDALFNKRVNLYSTKEFNKPNYSQDSGDIIKPLFDRKTSLEGLPQDLIDKLNASYKIPNAGVFSYDNLIKAYQQKAADQLQKERELPLQEKLMMAKTLPFTDSEGKTSEITVNEFLSGTVDAMKNASMEIKNDNLDAFEVVFNETDNELQTIVESGAKSIVETIEKSKIPVKLNYTVNDSSELIYDIQPTGELNEDQQDVFDNLQIDLMEWQQVLFDLNVDRRKSINNYLNTVVEIKKEDADIAIQKRSEKEGLIESLIKDIDPETGENYTVEKAKEIVKNLKDRPSMSVFDLAYKEYGVGSLMANDFYQATKGIFLAVPTIFGSEYAIDEQRQINKNKELYQSMLSYDNTQGQTSKYVFRTLAQQFPNIILAIGTAGAGTASGVLSTSAVKWAVAGTFGVSSGADKNRNLNLQRELVDVAKNQIRWLQDAKQKNKIDQVTYAKGMADANQTLAMNDLTDAQIIGSTLMTGIIEGGVTRYIGTANNSVKFLDDIAGGTSISMANLVKNSTWYNRGLFGIEYLKRTGLEVVEESIIYGGTQALSETLILGKDFELSQLDDIALSTIITAGTSNTSVAYSGLVNVSLASEIKEKSEKIASKKERAYKMLQRTDLTKSQRDALIADIGDYMSELAYLNEQAGTDVMALGAKNLRNLLSFEQIRNSLYSQAGVVLGSEKNVNRVVGQYKRKLKPVARENFEKQMSDVEAAINDVKNSPKDYVSVISTINNGEKGGLYDITAAKLKESGNKKWQNAKTPREKITLVMSEIRKDIEASFLKKAKDKRTRVGKFIEVGWLSKNNEQANLPKNQQLTKEDYFKNIAKTLQQLETSSVIITTESQKAAGVINNFENLKLIQAKDGNLKQELRTMLENKEIDIVDYNNILSNLKPDKETGATPNGFVVGDKYVVIDSKTAGEMMAMGQIEGGVVVVHEFAHVTDDAFFGNTTRVVKDENGNPKKDENGNVIVETVLSKRGGEYATNLFKFMAINKLQDSMLDKIHQESLAAVMQYGNYEVKRGKEIDFNTQSDRFKDEYTKEVQSRLFGEESIGNINYEKAEKFGIVQRKLNDWFSVGENMSTPQKAFEYAVSNNAAARKGDLTQIVRRTIAKQKAKPKSKGVKKSQSVSIVNKINQKNKNVENYKPITPDQLTTMVDKVANRTWSRFGRPIPLNIRQKFLGSKGDEGGRQKWLTDAKQILNTIALGFDASKASFDQYMANTGMQRANAWAKNEFSIPSAEQGSRVNVETSKEAQTKQDTGKDLKQRAITEAKENIPSIKENIKTKNKKSLISNVRKGVEKEVRYKLPKIGGKQTVKSKSNLIQALSKGLESTQINGKNLYATVIDEIGGRNKTLPQFEQFLNDNYSSLLSSGGLTTTYLSKAFPQAIQKYVNGMGWVNYDVWKGRTKGTKQGQVDFYRTGEGPYQGSTSGMQKIRRIPNIKNVIPLSQFKGKYIDGIKNKVKVAPTEALAKQILKEVGLEVFNEEINKESSTTKDQFINRQELLNQLSDVYNLEAEINLETERRGIKNSLSVLSPEKFNNWVENKNEFFQDILNLPDNKKNDYKSIRRAHVNVYGDLYNKEEHDGISRQFSKLLVPVTKADVEILRDEKSLFEYLEDIAFAADVNQTIVQFTDASIVNEDGITVPYKISEMTRNKDMILEGRQFVTEVFAPALINKYGKEKALDMLVAYAKSTFSQGQGKFGTFKYVDGQVVSSNESSNRTSLFGKADVDVLQNIIQKNFPNVVSIANNTIVFNDGTPSRKVDINTSADVKQGKRKNSVNHLKGLTKKQIAKDKADAKLAREFTEGIIDALPAKGENNNLTALILATLNASSNSSLRLAAPVWGRSTVMPYANLKRTIIKDGKSVQVANYRYEHAVPARVVLWYLYDSKINKNKDIDLDLLFEDYRVTIIPIKEVDNVLRDTGFSSIMLASYVPGDQTWWKRYFNRFTKGKIPYGLESYETGDIIGKDFQEYFENKMPVVFKSNSQKVVAQDRNTDIAMRNARSSVKYSNSIKKIRVFDFDDTLAKSNSQVLYTMPDGTRGSLNATEFAKQAAKLERKGVVWNFEQFNQVVDGKKGPLFNVAKTIQDKRGSEDIFVLTARPQEAALPIQEFLASIGLNIPIENITGLENGTAQAKADWIINKFAEGYNDFYFTDDAIKNVKAVKNALDVLDVKSKVQIARVKFSKSVSQDFNEMIERNKGIKADARYSEVVAQRKGRNKKRWNFFIPPSADDFRGLTMYMFSGRGKQGEKDMQWWNKTLILPYTRGIAAIERAKQQVSNDYRALNAGFPKIKRKLRKKISGEEFTHDEAVRVYLWDLAGYKIPGISKRDQAKLSKIVREDSDLLAFADGVLAITKQELYVEPSENWSASTILADLNSLTNNVNRKEYLSEFIENSDLIFSQDNLNKIEAIYGSRVKEALINIIHRMKTGRNSTVGDNRIVNRWNQWVNNSVGAIMFLNRRSALLQLISNVNFINWSDNNPVMAAAAFANQPQYWKDVVKLFNSDKLKQRRSGLKGDINEAEIAAAVKGAKDKMTAFISVLLKYGFTFTQVADSVAIATGGATMYRNRINTYTKQGMSTADAESKAFEDFSLISDESQQSADPMMISGQQAGVMGRLILAFQNTPMQYTRLMKKSALDLLAGRGDAKTHMSKIIYYGAVQNFIFSALSNALFALVPGFEDEDENLTDKEQLEKYGKVIDSKQRRILNNMIDTVLRGSGLAGAVVSTLKNGVLRYQQEEQKGFTADHTYTLIELANVSPPIGSKLRKIYSGIQTKKFEKDAIAERGFDVTIDGKFNLSPSYQVAGDVISGFTNLPLDRMVAEINAITEALDTRNTAWQRIALSLGYRTWDVNAKNEEHDLLKEEGKARRKEEGKIKAKATRERKRKEKYEEYLKSLSPEEYKKEIEQQKEIDKMFENINLDKMEVDFDKIFENIDF